MTDLTRRDFGKLSLGTFLLGTAAHWPELSLAATPAGEKLHGLSAFGALKYSADAKQFDYVNADAPKGGVLNFSVPDWAYNQNPQTFDTLNTFTLKNNAPPRMELTYDALMVRAVDEPSAVYGRLAESVEVSQDRNAYTFVLRQGPRFHDGTPVTAADVAFSYATFKEQGHPQLQVELTHLDAAEVVDERTVTLRFNGNQSDRTILTVALMPIISKAFFETNDFNDTGLMPVLGSGPYKVGRLSQGVFVEYDRVEDYWGKDMFFAVGQSNFDTIRIEFFRARQAAFEAFKKGDVTWREEFTSKTWALEYNFPAIQDGRAVKREFPGEKIARFQAWAINTRRAKLKDPRTVQGINHCFDFEWTKKNLFYGSYNRGQSFFSNSQFVSQGEPQGDELALLQSLTASLPEGTLGAVPVMPVSDGSGSDRGLLRKANQLFADAGWKRNGTQLVDENGAAFTVEILIRSPTFERILAPFVANLKRLGVQANIQLVDPAQFRRRLDTFDFDMVGSAFNLGALPTAASLENFFGSATRDREGSRNYSGISHPAVDELITLVARANSVEELTVRLTALDRVLRNLHSWIPNWNGANHRVAHWDLFGMPDEKPDYDFPVETTWWWDADKAAKQQR